MTTRKKDGETPFGKSAGKGEIEKAVAEIEANYPSIKDGTHASQLSKHLIQDYGFSEEDVAEFLAEQQKSADKAE